MSGHPDNTMIFLGFFNIYFHKIVLKIEGSFILNIRNTYFKNSLDGFFGNLNEIHIGRGEKGNGKDC